MAINPQGNTYCNKCRTRIASGKNYCYAHYQEALIEYRREFQEYTVKKRNWNSLSNEEQGQQHGMAEQASSAVFAGCGGGILGGVLWYYLAKTQGLDGLFGVLIIVASVVACLLPPVQKVSGRVFRALAYAPLYMLAFAVVIWLLSLVSKIIANNASAIYLVAVVLSLVLALLVEVGGGHHASAEPTEPTAPRP